MTTRARRPTDETGTGTGTDVYTPERQRALFGASPGERIASASESWDHDATEVDARGTTPADRPTLTEIDAARRTPPIEQATPTEIVARRERPAANLPNGERPAANLPNGERSEPIQMISMKNRAASEPRAEPRVPLHVQLRSMADVAGTRTPAAGLGRLAPPRDALQARKRRQRDNVVWACVAIVLACGISLGIWLIAGR